MKNKIRKAAKYLFDNGYLTDNEYAYCCGNKTVDRGRYISAAFDAISPFIIQFLFEEMILSVIFLFDEPNKINVQLFENDN